MFLVLIDANLKWLGVEVVPSASTGNTAKQLRSVFVTHGLPEILVTNSGTCCTSQEFKEFTTRNGIRHICMAKYHLTSNGQAERAIRIVKISH